MTDDEAASGLQSVDDSMFKIPDMPRKGQQNELARLRQQIDKLLQQLEQRRQGGKEKEQKVERRMKVEKERMERQMDRLLQQLEQQRQDSK